MNLQRLASCIAILRLSVDFVVAACVALASMNQGRATQQARLSAALNARSRIFIG